MALTEVDYAEITSDVVCTATVEASANSIVALPAHTYDGLTVITLEFFFPSWQMSTTSEVAFLTLFQDGSVYGRVWDSRAWVTSAALGGALITRRFTPASGSRTYSMRGHSSSTNNFTVKAGAGGASAYLPAYLRAVSS